MIVFKTLRYKNFLSTGDSFTQIDLNASSSTLIVGQNGAGKSTMLDALSFALFGKAHRSITKNQMVNSINGKACVVEVEFSALGSEYRVIRGIKPVKFEIYRDGVLLNQDSHNKEYQKILEQNILKLNHKSFHQIVVLGSSSFVPFMQLPAQHRREVIEDLLDINVFSKMNGILKERVSLLKERDRANRSELELINEKIFTQQKYVQKLQNLAKAQRSDRLAEIRDCTAQIDALEKKKSGIEENESDSYKLEIESLTRKLREIEKYDHQFKVKQKELQKEIEFYESNDTCPTCDQGIGEELKSEKTESARTKFNKFEQGREEANKKITEFNEQLASVNEQLEKIQDQIRAEYEINVEINQIQSRISKLHEEIQRVEEETGNVDESIAQLDQYSMTKMALTDERMKLVDDGAYTAVITELLKDTGIKTKIIKQYLPVINNLVNKYLQVLDFFVSFHLDDTFKESIKSRHRDEFSYDSFSEGEKQRIDLALLFTWRQVAKMKNSIATNLLILDETFDSSLDVEGVDNLTNILDTLGDDSNVFIISHKGELLEGKFEDKIEFVKRKNFSVIA
jgi:DNA repair exonuclease SbcCD ATPase subunit